LARQCHFSASSSMHPSSDPGSSSCWTSQGMDASAPGRGIESLPSSMAPWLLLIAPLGICSCTSPRRTHSLSDKGRKPDLSRILCELRDPHARNPLLPATSLPAEFRQPQFCQSLGRGIAPPPVARRRGKHQVHLADWPALCRSCTGTTVCGIPPFSGRLKGGSGLTTGG
jgi:hypothetical protein